MLSIVRGGPRILVLESNSIGSLCTYLEKNLYAFHCDLDTAFEKSSEGSIIVLLTEKMKESIQFEDIKEVLLIEQEVDWVLCHLLNHKKYDLISCSRMGPRTIIMRIFGNTQKVLNELSKDYAGDIGSIANMLETHGEGTIITFTESRLTKPISLSNVYESSLFVRENYATLLKKLKVHDLKYLNIGLENKEWYALTIKIYDSYGEYLIHYQRLIKVIESLELGMILGESWGTDAATVFYSVGVYEIKFFTFFEPKFIKKILLGLEYLEDGTRIVDLDLYYKRKKIYWSELREKDIKDKIQLSHKFRKEISSRLSEDDLQEVVGLENDILNTR
ncbi:hypothetical protein QBE52_07630 [Clostridiaceae bacterium 35-E11]